MKLLFPCVGWEREPRHHKQTQWWLMRQGTRLWEKQNSHRDQVPPLLWWARGSPFFFQSSVSMTTKWIWYFSPGQYEKWCFKDKIHLWGKSEVSRDREGCVWITHCLSKAHHGYHLNLTSGRWRPFLLTYMDKESRRWDLSAWGTSCSPTLSHPHVDGVQLIFHAVPSWAFLPNLLSSLAGRGARDLDRILMLSKEQA